MTTVTQVKSLDELLHLWPRLLVLSRGKEDHILRVALACLVNGAVFVVRDDYGVAGACCVGLWQDVGLIFTMPKGSSRQCLEVVEDWARGRGLRRLEITNSRWSGSSFRHFEKSLGFERKKVTFVKELSYG